MAELLVGTGSVGAEAEICAVLVSVEAVTGAAAGIGLAAAEAYAEAGANVAITYNSNKAAHKAAEEIAKRFNVKSKILLREAGMITQPNNGMMDRCG